MVNQQRWKNRDLCVTSRRIASKRVASPAWTRHARLATPSMQRNHSSKRRRRGEPITSRHLSAKHKPSVSHRVSACGDNSLADLGITGFLSDDEEVSSLELSATLSNPSPEQLGHRLGNPHHKVSASHTHLAQPQVCIFDSPEDGRRGWSELGLKLRRSRAEAKTEGYFSTIADELVLAIFTHIPKHILVNCALVCRRWKRLVYDESLWRRLDLSGQVLQGQLLSGQVLSRGVEYLRLSQCQVLGDAMSVSHDRKLCRVQYLDLSMATISVGALDQLLSLCTQIKKLSLENLTVNNNVCRSISQNVMLTTLNCAMVSGLTYSGLRHILHSCNLLAELNLAWVKLTENDVGSVVSNLPHNLNRLNLSGCRENIDDSDVKVVVERCPFLQELDLSDSLGLSERSLDYICQSLTHLQVLHLSRCYYIVPEAFSRLQAISSLSYLNIHSMMQEENLLAVRQSLPSIAINSQRLSTVARPTVGIYRTSIWGHRVRDLKL